MRDVCIGQELVAVAVLRLCNWPETALLAAAALFFAAWCLEPTQCVTAGGRLRFAPHPLAHSSRLPACASACIPPAETRPGLQSPGTRGVRAVRGAVLRQCVARVPAHDEHAVGKSRPVRACGKAACRSPAAASADPLLAAHPACRRDCGSPPCRLNEALVEFEAAVGVVPPAQQGAVGSTTPRGGAAYRHTHNGSLAARKFLAECLGARTAAKSVNAVHTYRDGEWLRIPVGLLVKGDLIALAEHDVEPAPVKLVEPVAPAVAPQPAEDALRSTRSLRPLPTTPILGPLSSIRPGIRRTVALASSASASGTCVAVGLHQQGG